MAAKQPAANFSSDPEFAPCFSAGADIFCVYGLNQIGAQHAYAEGAYGGGVVVAVIDSGIDRTHVELDSKVSGQSRDVANNKPISDIVGHGTFVAGIIAAEKNGIGIHGVAFESTILAVRVDRERPPADCAPLPTPCSDLFTSDIAAGISYATGRAHVFNLSLGGPTPAPEMEQPLIDAMAAGAIIVVAAGNESALEPSWPAAYAGDTGVGEVNEVGQLIAVGAVDSIGNLAPFSNQCGAAMDYCLVAPGVEIISTIPNQGLAVADGTSFAAPHVSGGAALLIQRFPTLTAAEVVQILLMTATDRGALGVDTVYGHGLLNLAQAILPVGTISVPLTASADGKSVGVASTMLSLGTAFGDALTGNALIDRALALDDFDRPYVAGLDKGIRHAGRGFGLEALVAARDIETVEAALPGGLSLAMGVSGAAETGNLSDWPPADNNQIAPALHGFSLSGGMEDGALFRFGYDVAAAQQLAGADDATSAGLYWMAADMLSPHYALVGAGNGMTVARNLGGATTAVVGWVEETGVVDVAATGDARIGEMSITHRFDGGSKLRAGLASIDETGGFLGSDAAGAFAVEGATSRVYTASGTVALGAAVELVGSYTLVDATMEAAGNSLLSDWSAVRADAFGLGVAKRGVFGTGDRIGLLVGQPLRVSDAAATLTAPVDYTLDKTVVQGSERVSLVPTGREIDLQLAYDADLAGESRISSWLMMQLDPGHVADAAPAYGVGMRFNTQF